MKRWIIFGKDLSSSAEEDLYTQFVANLMSAILGAGMIGAYHLVFHM